ncbi:MAG TPA: TPM domain-containing protein [Candidatus Absconditabacterales bacterium]|nr:TPM domain-containing protein [Candidatus Absconditabacterales bacterium]HMT26823.1 TPM domain-containing protein [Candidatus Absconditabacterales bacterium]
MKKIICFLIGIIFLGGVFAQNSLDPMNFSKLQNYITDYSEVLTAGQKSELEKIAQDYDKTTTNQIVTVLFPQRNGNELFDIGMKLFRENGVGEKDKNNGLLLLIATEEKKIRIVVGYGLEGVIPDVKARDIIEEKIRPRVNSGDYFQAVKNFYSASSEAIGTGEWNEAMQGNQQENSEWYGVGMGFGVLIAILAIYFSRSFLMGSVLLSGVSSFLAYFIQSSWLGGELYLGFLFGLLFTLAMFGSRGSRGGGGRSSGGGFSGGGFSGGGGSSGGGGAGD